MAYLEKRVKYSILEILHRPLNLLQFLASLDEMVVIIADHETSPFSLYESLELILRAVSARQTDQRNRQVSLSARLTFLL